jgi:hypothetical protein
MGVIMKLLNTKIIMGLIIATGIGFVPVQLDASSPYPHVSTSSEVENVLQRIVDQVAQHAEQTQAVQQNLTVAATQPAAATQRARYCLPARSTGYTLSNSNNSLDLATRFFLAHTMYVIFFGFYDPTRGIFDPVKHGCADYMTICANALVAGVTLAFTHYFNNTTEITIATRRYSRPHFIAIPRTAEILTTTCSICTEDLLRTENQLPLLATNCSTPHVHIFHESCVKDWLTSHGTCPMCTAQVPDPGIVQIIDSATEHTQANS